MDRNLSPENQGVYSEPSQSVEFLFDELLFLFLPDYIHDLAQNDYGISGLEPLDCAPN